MRIINYPRQSLIYLLAVLLFLLPRVSESCVSCFHPTIIPRNHNTHHQAHAINSAASHGITPYATAGGTNSVALVTTATRQLLEICKKRCMNLHRSIWANPRYKESLRLSASATIVVGGMLVIAHHHAPSSIKQKLHRGLWRNEHANGQNDKAITEDDGDDQAVDDNAEEEEPVMSSAMIATIGVYKNFISPLLPPACRFAPTCSQYGVQAIKEFGPSKGVILTSWRLLRCSPFGGKGYDPPKWPPVSYTYASY